MDTNEQIPKEPTETPADDFESEAGERFGEPVAIETKDLNPVLDGWPKPTQAAQTEKATDQPLPNPAQNSGAEIKDGKGRVFNPAIHSANPDGSPKFNKNGLFIFKGVGRGKGNKSTEAEETAAYGADHFDAQAEQLVTVITGTAASVFDDEGWFPESEGEKDFVKNPTARFLRESNMPQLPAWLEMSLCWSGYSLKRASRPKTKEKLILWWLKLRGLFGKKKDEPLPSSEGIKKMDSSERKVNGDTPTG